MECVLKRKHQTNFRNNSEKYLKYFDGIYIFIIFLNTRRKSLSYIAFLNIIHGFYYTKSFNSITYAKLISLHAKAINNFVEVMRGKDGEGLKEEIKETIVV